jgi:hypothetical protein
MARPAAKIQACSGALAADEKTAFWRESVTQRHLDGRRADLLNLLKQEPPEFELLGKHQATSRVEAKAEGSTCIIDWGASMPATFLFHQLESLLYEVILPYETSSEKLPRFSTPRLLALVDTSPPSLDLLVWCDGPVLSK